MSLKIIFSNIISQTKKCAFDSNLTILEGCAVVSNCAVFENIDDTTIARKEFNALFDADELWGGDHLIEALKMLETDSEVSTLIVKVDEGRIVTYVEKSASDLLKAFNESKHDGDIYCDISDCSGYEPLKQKVSSLLKAMP
jgi:hypothetical protein